MKNHFLSLLAIIGFYGCSSNDPNTEKIKGSFDSVNATLSAASKSANASIESLMDSIDHRNPGIGAYTTRDTWKGKANAARSMSGQVVNYLEQLKTTLKNVPADDLTAVEDLMIKKGKGKELYEKLEQYNNDLIGLDAGYHSVYKDPPVDLSHPKTSKTWQESYFKMVPAFAAITLLSKFQNDIRNSEMRFVRYCFEQLSASS